MKYWIGLAAFVFQTLIPLAQALPSPSSSDFLIICTKYGLRTLPAMKSEGQRTTHKSTCAVCISIDAVRMFVPNMSYVQGANSELNSQAYPMVTAPLVLVLYMSHNQPRAPPRLT